METTPAAPPPINPPATTEDKTVAIVAYLTIFGFIAAAIINSNKKTKLGAFHLRQMLGFMLTGMVVGFGAFILAFIPILGFLCVLALWLCLLVCWVLGLVAAINGKMTPMPVIGPIIQNMLGTTFD
jgi:uncharacterized membrane protein